MNILFIGASGCGKGTQAKFLVDNHNFCHLSMGDVLKEEVKKGTETGKLIDEYQKGGNLVPLEITLKALENKITSTQNANGFILDGFPRTMEQAKALRLDIDAVFSFNIDLEKLKDRLVNRRVCKECNSNCHVSKLKNGHCPVCGGEVYQRTDDNEQSINKRLDFYRKEVLPVVEYYRNKNYPVFDIDADMPIEKVASAIENSLNSVQSNDEK